MGHALRAALLLLAVAMTALLLLVALLLLELSREAKKLAADTDAAIGSAKALAVDTRREVLDIGGITSEVRHTLQVTENAQVAAAENSARATEELDADLMALNVMLERANAALAQAQQGGSSLAAGTHDSLARLNAALDGANGDIRELAPTLANLAQASAGLAATTEDPATRETLDNVAAITADAHAETSLLLDRTRQAFAPQNKFVSVLKALAGGTVTGAELWYYLSH